LRFSRLFAAAPICARATSVGAPKDELRARRLEMKETSHIPRGRLAGCDGCRPVQKAQTAFKLNASQKSRRG
jgi:hypothetical protein